MNNTNFKRRKRYRKLTLIMYWSVRIVTLVLFAYSIVGVLLKRSDDSQVADYLFIALNSSALFLASFVPAFLNKRFRISVPEFLLRIYIGFVTSALLFGEICNFFVYISWWDSALHLFSGSLIGVVGFSLLNILNNSEDLEFKLSPGFVALFVFCFSLAVGVIWEIIEYAIDGISSSNMQRFKDSITGELWLGRKALRDTMEDFMLNTIGATFISILGYIDLKRKSGFLRKMAFKRKQQNQLNN